MFSLLILLLAAGDFVILLLLGDGFDNADADLECGPPPFPASNDRRVLLTGMRDVGEVGFRVPEFGGVGYIAGLYTGIAFGGCNLASISLRLRLWLSA